MTDGGQRAIIVTDLGFGDAGKGTIVDFLTRSYKAHTTVRFNGGAQAAHNVVTPNGQHHTFAQFGSGTFVPGVRTYLSRFMLVDPYAMFREEQHLRSVGVHDAFARMLLDRRAPIITPFQQVVNRLRELARRDNRHGSCGMGIGETVSDMLYHPEIVLYAGDLADHDCVVEKLELLRELKYSEIVGLLPSLGDDQAAQAELRVFESRDLIEVAAENYAYLAAQVQVVDEAVLQAILKANGVVIFEGAQGVLLDELYGFAPYTSWSTTTFANAMTLLEGYCGQITKLGVIRSYFTRHGAGPFVTEDETLVAALPERHNTTSLWQQAFRVGYFDAVAVRYALQAVQAIDGLAITHVDCLKQIASWNVCEAYQSQESPGLLTPFFEHTGQMITAIKLPDIGDWDRQVRLTQHLFCCKPCYRSYSSLLHSETQYISQLEQTLGIPVLITSNGPTACGKQFSGTL